MHISIGADGFEAARVQKSAALKGKYYRKITTGSAVRG